MGSGLKHIIICDEHNRMDVPDCRVELMAYENMGNEQLVYFSLAGQTFIARRPPVETNDIGKEMGVRFLNDKIIFLDENTGEVFNTAL